MSSVLYGNKPPLLEKDLYGLFKYEDWTFIYYKHQYLVHDFLCRPNTPIVDQFPGPSETFDSVPTGGGNPVRQRAYSSLVTPQVIKSHPDESFTRNGPEHF